MVAINLLRASRYTRQNFWERKLLLIAFTRNVGENFHSFAVYPMILINNKTKQLLRIQISRKNILQFLRKSVKTDSFLPRNFSYL